MPLSSPPRRTRLGRTVSLIGITAASAVALTLGQSASAAEFAAAASVSPQVQYLGDSVGTTFTVTVENTGTSDSIGAVEVARPSRAWTITECPSAPAGWSAQRSDKMCRYRSAAGTGDNIAPGTSSSAFQVRATVIPGARDIVGSWSVQVSRSDNFDKRSKLVAAASEPPGVDLTAYSFEVLDAVVDPATTTPGAACPTPSKSAASATGGHTVVICGRNRTTGTSTPTAAQSTLGGSFVGSPGSFSSAAVDPTPTSVILGSWTNVTITSTPGTGKSVVAVIGSAADRTSPETTLTDYEALAVSPDAVDDVADVGEDASGTTIDVLANDTDTENDTLTVTAVDSTGTTGLLTNNGTDVTYDPNGQFENLGAGETATDTFTYTASDGNGGTDTATVTVTVNGANDPPTAADDTDLVGEDSTGAAIIVLANDTDPDAGDTLTVTAIDATGTTGLLTNNGTDVTYDPNGQFENLGAGETATDTFTYTASDGNGGTDTATVTVTVNGANDPPNAVDDTRTVSKDSTGDTVSVLANDTDPDTTDALTISAIDTTGTTGQVTNNGIDVTYDPNGQFGSLGPEDTATDTFTYTVSDGNGGTDTATVTITINYGNVAPTADATSASGNEDGGAITVNLSGDDANGDALTFAAGTATEGLVTVPGSVSCTGTVPNHCTATSTYTPNANFSGSDSFTYTVNDGTFDSPAATASITVNPVNDAPSFTKGANQTVAEDAGPQSVSSWATAMSKGPPDESAQTLWFVVTTDNDDLFSTGPAVSPTGTLTYTPAANANGVAAVTLKIVDDGGTANGGVDESTTQQFTITISPVNDPPTAVDDTGTTDEDTTLNVSVPGVLANDTDPDSSDILTVVELNGSATLTGTSTDGAAVTINADGSFTYDPGSIYQGLSTGQSDTDTFAYALSDGNGGTDTATVTITINGVSDAPTAVADSFDAIGNTGLFVGTTKPTGQAGKVITGSVLTNDTDPDTAHASLVVEPVTDAATTLGGTITIESDGNFTYHPDDGDVATTDTFTYRVCDASPCNSSTVANATGTLSLPLTGQVWYVRNNQAAGGDGTSDAPFDTLLEAETASGTGDTTFVHDGDNTTTGLASGYQMDANERLIGEVSGLALDPDGGGGLPLSPLYPATAGATPALTTTSAEDVVYLAAGTLVDGFVIDPGSLGGGIGGGTAAGAAGAAGNVTIANVHVNDTSTSGTGVQPGLELNGTTGTSNVSNLEVDNGGSATATGVRLNNAGTVNFADTGTISVTTSGAKALDAVSTSFGTSVFDDITVTGSGSGGVNLDATTGTVALGDGLGADVLVTATSGATPALRANNAANVTVGAAGTDELHATGGPGFDITGAGGTYAFDVVDSSSSTTSGLVYQNVGNGTLDIDDGTISGYAFWGFNHSGGSGNVDIGADIADGPGTTVVVINRNGGNVRFTGLVSDSSDAHGSVLISNNPGTDVRFEGGLSLDSGTSDAFSASTTNTVVVTDPNGPGIAPDNTLKTTTGTALRVANTTIGADGLAFTSVSSNGAWQGIVLNTTGSLGRLQITGNGGTCTALNTVGCSGGEISNMSNADDATATPNGTGIVLNNTLNPSFSHMWVHDTSNYAIRGTNVAGFTMLDSVINGNNGTSALTAYKDGSVRFEELTGTVTMTNVAISGGYFTNLMVDNTAGVLNGTFDNVDSGALNTTGGDDAVQFEGIGASDMNVDFKNSTITTAGGDLFQYIGDGTGGGDLDFTNNTLSNNDPSIVTGGGGVALVAGAKGAATMDVLNNTMRDSRTNALTVIKSRDNTAGTNNLVANISGNTIGLAGTVNSGSLEGDGMEITTGGDGNATFNVTNNDIRQYNSSALQFVAGLGVAETGQFNLNISGNSAGNPGTNPAITLLQGIRVDSGVDVGDTFATCVKFGPNSITGSSDAPTKDFRLVASQNTTIRQPGYAGGSTDGTAFANFAAALIGGGAQGTAVANAPATFTGTGSTCP